MAILRLLAWLVAASLPACLLLALWRHGQIRGAPRVPGEVVAHRERPGCGDDGGPTWALVVRYREPSGAGAEFSTSLSCSPPAAAVGEAVTVCLLPGGPVVLDFVHLYLMHWIWACVALCCLGLAAGPAAVRWLYCR